MSKKPGKFDGLKFEVTCEIPNGPRTCQFLPLWEAGAAYDSGWAKVTLGRTLLPNGTVRDMTEKEKRAISAAADEWSASK